MNPTLDPGPSAPRKSLFGRLSDFVFGYDFFVSYCWADGRDYAVALVQRLQDQGFECFLDSSDYAKGDNWRDQGRRALKKTSRLLLVGTPKALASEPVQNELAIFSRLGRRILPIDFGGSIAGAPGDSPVVRHLSPDTLFIEEPLQALRDGPSPATLDAIRATFDLLRQQQKRGRLLASATLAFAALSIVALVLFFLASRRQAESMALAWTAQGETLFEANPVEGLYLARQGWETLPAGSRSLDVRLTARVLRLAANGRLVRVGTDVLDAELTDNGQVIVARRHRDGEIRDAVDLHLIEPLSERIRQISPDGSGRYLVLERQSPNNDLRFALRRREDGELVGYRKRMTGAPPPVFPRGRAQYFYSDTGFSPTIRRLTDNSLIGHGGFDIMRFHYKSGWPVFALSYRDDENSRRPPDAELFDIDSGAVIHRFAVRELALQERRSGGYRLIRFTRAGDDREEAIVYLAPSAYVVGSNGGLRLWVSGRGLELPRLPTQISVVPTGDGPYVLLSYGERSEIWSVADRERIAEFPEFEFAGAVPDLAGWLVTPARPGSQSRLLRVIGGSLVSRPMAVRVARIDRRGDAQGRYFVVDTESRGRELRRRSDGSPVPLPAPVRRFTFARDPSVTRFAVHYRGTQPSEIRRIADASLLYTIDHPGSVEIEFEQGEFFIINYLKPGDRDTLSRAELRRYRDATLVMTGRDEILGYTANTSGELIILETGDAHLDDRDRGEHDQTVFLRSGDAYQRPKKGFLDLAGKIVLHPDPLNLTFVGRDSETRHARIFAIAPEDNDPTTQSVHHVGSSDAPVEVVRFFSSGSTDYLLMGTEGDRLELWNMENEPRRIFRSQVGLTGFTELPGEGRLLVWFDDGRSYVLDTRLIDLATAAAGSGNAGDIQRFLGYIQGELFTSGWLDPKIVEEQQALMRLD